MLTLRFTLALIALALLAAPAAYAQGQATVTGTVTYLERILLPPTAKVTVQLLDVSLADAAATTLAEQVIDTAGQGPPYAYSLSYDPAAIKDNLSYSVRATITDGEQLIFTSTTNIPVITRGNPTSDVEILVSRVGDSGTGGTSTGSTTAPSTLPSTGGPGDAIAPLLLLAALGLGGGLLLRRRKA